MKQKNFLKIFLFFLTWISTFNLNAQTTIYSENFTGQDDKGSIGPTPTTDLSGVDWTVDISDTDLSANTDWFKVTSEIFEARDIDGDAIWISPSINISGFTNVQFSLSAVEDGTMEAADIFNTEYRIDSGTWTAASTNGLLNDDFTSATVSQLGLSGGSLEIRVTMNNNAGTEYHRLDDILVQGNPASTDPTITFDSATSTETETDATFTSANIPISVTNYDGNQIDIDVAITGGTAEPADYSYTTQSLFFSSDSTQNITIDINDDVDTDNETIIFTITETSSVTGLVISQATHTLTITDDDLPNIIINEILASPGTSTTASDSNFGDANGDGLRPDSREDEFIEIVNLETTIVNIGGYTISETNGVVHTFSDPTNLPAGGSIVVFGGGIPTDIPGLSVTSSSGNLELSNSGETVTLKNSEGTTINVVTYSSLSNQSFARNFDLTGTGTGHNSIVSNPVNFSPGRYNTTGEPFTTNTWTGATDTSWTEASNWSLGTVPGSGDDVQIINTTNQPLASGAVTVNSVTIASGATLTAQSTFTGSVTYNRSLATDNWYLMSSPVSGETYDSSWVIDNNIDDTTSSNGNIGIATYTTTDDTWSYLQTGGSGAFTNGKGFSIKQDATGTVSFTGTLNTSDVSAAVATGGNDGYNLIGNPFTTNLSSAMFLSGNTANLTSETIWVWNQGTDTYDAYVTGESFILAPTQGFFVSASTATNLTLAESYQTSTAGTFQKSANAKIELYVTDGTNKRFVKMYYNPTATKSFDNGYDGEIFGGIKNSFELYTNLISNNVGKKYQVQSLPNSDLETMIIPIGITSEANKEITFTAEALNLPSGIKVFLEDRFTNTFTRLDEANSEYKFTSDVALDGTGRFYLHTRSSALNIENLDLDNVSIYKTDNSNLRIVGLSEGKASIKLFNILGKQVLKTTFTSNGIKDISLPTLTKGIYIVQLETETGKLNKKITLE
ncbi:lamin tail domain-containing protein [Polaribacter vadi]|uniref:lamin tail domain-containing protein n=1 Tax=Polaribacter TaxID=52959 RepID=UPI001C093A01|nr:MULTISPECIES: lamin tail domain-containing protein [Polaribacter]MBU3009859.1 lamin tail domain-containing protein [Polaribacter vadi]MDO6739665.1 lamin tail domain-containing protein [Polaribacter sp. 1_MG-2023]